MAAASGLVMAVEGAPEGEEEDWLTPSHVGAAAAVAELEGRVQELEGALHTARAREAELAEEAARAQRVAREAADAQAELMQMSEREVRPLIRNPSLVESTPRIS